MRVTSSEFQQNVGRYQDAAQHAPVIITRHNRPHTVLLSAALFEVLTKGRVARPIEELDAGTLQAIAGSSGVPDDATYKVGTFQEFKEFTLAVARGERTVGADDPKIWIDARTLKVTPKATGTKRKKRIRSDS